MTDKDRLEDLLRFAAGYTSDESRGRFLFYLSRDASDQVKQKALRQLVKEWLGI